MQNNNEETIEITAVVKDHIEGEPCEISFYHEGELIGYQTYGRFDPAYPYQGQPTYRVETQIDR